MGLIDDLRKKIDSHHEEAIHALEVLKGYLASETIPSVNGASKGRRGKAGSYREQVSKVIKMTWASVDQIADATGLDRQRVRGVLNAPRLKKTIETREVGGKKEYRIKSD